MINFLLLTKMGSTILLIDMQISLNVLFDSFQCDLGRSFLG